MKHSRLTLCLLITLSFFAAALYAADTPNTIDPSFNAQVRTNSFGLKSIAAMAALPDGKILVSGSFNSYNEQPVGGFIRLNADGSLDPTFNNNLMKTGSYMYHILPQPDGKIIIAGLGLDYGQTSNMPQIMRLNADGTVDSSFTYSAGGLVYNAAVDSSGRILVRGQIQTVQNGVSVTRYFFRLNADGSLDPSFNFTEPVAIYSIAAQNNKIIIAAEARGFFVMRINENGSVDNSFTLRPFDNSVNSVVVQPDNKILVSRQKQLLRLNADGSDDASFQQTNFASSPHRIFLAADGKITISEGNSTQDGYTVNRMLPNGAPDPSFTSPSYFYEIGVRAIQPDGSILLSVSASPDNSSNVFMRLLPSGAPDTNFNAGGMAFQTINPGRVRAITAQSDGKIIIGGNFDKVNGLNRPKIVRLNADSTVDAGFQINTTAVGNYFSRIYDVYYAVIQPDKKIVVSGNFDYSVGGLVKSNLVRLNSDGSIDPSFNLTVSIGDVFWVNGATFGRNKPLISADSKIFVGTSSSGAGVPRLLFRLNSNGSLDSSLSSPAQYSQGSTRIVDAALQPDGKILIGGSFASGSTGVSKSFLTRLNSNGSIDATFPATETEDNEITTFSLLPGGKILIAKLFYDGALRTRIQRLNADGTVDASFASGTGAEGRINSLLVLPDGNILVGGQFTKYNIQPKANLALLDADGNISATDYNVNDEVLTLTLDNENRVLIGGVFTVVSINGNKSFARSHLARLIETVSRTPFDFDGDGKSDISVFRPSNSVWYQMRSQSGFSARQFGVSTDKLVPADYDGDGRTDFAVYRPSNGEWSILRSSDNNLTILNFGTVEDIPRPGDFDGDGRADITVWRPSNGVWYRLNSSDNKYVAAQFGANGDAPVIADFDGDGKSDTAVYRPSNGVWYWINTSNNHFGVKQFGTEEDIPAVGDFDGDRSTEIAVFRPSNGVWYRLNLSSGQFSAVQFGQNGDVPAVGDYDGDGKSDTAVYRPSNGVWYLQQSRDGFAAAGFGTTGDRPIQAAFIP